MDATGENSVAEINEDVLAGLVRINDPAFNSHADVTHEKVLKIDTTTPRVISLDITVIYPIRSRKNVRAPKRDIEFPVSVPLGARRWGHLLYFLTLISISGKSVRCEQREREQTQPQLCHLFLLLVKSPPNSARPTVNDVRS